MSGFTSRAIAYLKPLVPGEGGMVLPAEESFVVRPFAESLLTTYLVDLGDRYQYVQHRHLREDGIDADELHDLALDNLAELAESRPTNVYPHGNIFAVIMGGDFEASLLQLDWLWDEGFRQFVTGDYAVAIPARDMLAFCDAESAVGLQELRDVIGRVSPSGDHLLSDRLYVRQKGTWAPMPR